ncbi:MAG: TrbC/VirB2 family protein [Sphingorhabdus sp.]|jgi:type IV secretory pathway VirB2 component (pilin)|uniref:TrbC/VirB2 family protein n=1 Tax=Sphingorhabdus sp. TaxID=1902408 RepID=UPI0038FC91EF
MKNLLKRMAILWPMALLSSPAFAQQDPAGSGPIVRAAQWLQGTLLGNVATAAAVVAVAAVGFLMLTGRMNWRYGMTVVLGCFILFGAVAIVSGIQSAAGAG